MRVNLPLSLAAAGLLVTPATAAELSVMTYNVRALPWPIASGRGQAADAIAARLRALRTRGQQPHVVVVQEAFTSAGRGIGPAAGYRYVSYGPDASNPAPGNSHADATFVAGARTRSGETLGKWTNSGLAIFSDYPIVGATRLAYPICAGFDCLANKGVLAVRIAVPGVERPVTVVGTHLNSRRASGADPVRSLYAYRRQLDVFAHFVRLLAARGDALLVAGDFNVGRAPDRRLYFGTRVWTPAVALTSAVAQCARAVPSCAIGDANSVGEAVRRNKDWLLFRSAPALRVQPLRVSAPFGRARDGSMLSDHIGIAVSYRLAAWPAATSLTTRRAPRPVT